MVKVTAQERADAIIDQFKAFTFDKHELASSIVQAIESAVAEAVQHELAIMRGILQDFATDYPERVDEHNAYAQGGAEWMRARVLHVIHNNIFGDPVEIVRKIKNIPLPTKLC